MTKYEVMSLPEAEALLASWHNETICTCCMGAGVHERYIPELDRWTQTECTSCEGLGYITPERSTYLWGMAKLEPKKQETPHRG